MGGLWLRGVAGAAACGWVVGLSFRGASGGCVADCGWMVGLPFRERRQRGGL
ncbi:hypothetical protein ABZ215_28350 [Amycolatopsis sp. NPDC006131]|uniref:hypothetical protein n=1 Tax=Amycolatopsis sp. NPDC006131 TaxID=3156731 RepID=UPI00339E8F05